MSRRPDTIKPSEKPANPTRRTATTKRADGAELLIKVTTRIAVGDPTQAIFEAIVAGVEDDRPGLWCSLLLLSDDGRLTLGAAPSLPDFYNQAIDGVAIGPSVGSCGTAAFRNERVIVTDIATDPLWADFKELAAQAGLASCWSEPIRGAGGRVLGTFAIYQSRPCAPEPAQIELIQAAAYLAAIAIERDQALAAAAESWARAEQAKASQQATARDLETFFAVSPDLLCITNSRGEFVHPNKAWRTVLGYDPEKLKGQVYLPYLHPDDVDLTLAAVQALNDASQEVNLINRYRCADGRYKSIEWRVNRSDDLVFAIGRDVTERLAAEAELKAAKLAAEAASTAKSDFLANMSHEVRTPLNGVIGVLDALAQTPLTAAQREMVDLIQTSGATLERLVSDILDVSKIEAGRLELEIREFDLEDALTSVLEVARIRADEKGLAFKVAISDAAKGRFRGDSVRLRQVLDNLLSNAIKFTASGEVAVRIEAHGDKAAEADELTLTVSDTGVGFDAEKAANLFDRFSQADGTITRRFGGSGLGLAISKALVEMMGGAVTATSTPGRGSVFTVRVPAPRVAGPKAEPAAPAARAGRLEALTEDRPLRVLLAEDNVTNQKVVALILAPLEVDLTIVDDGDEAVRVYEAQDFDLVLMDMQMPVMDGLAATRAIRAFERDHPARRRAALAMLSANAMAHHCDEALEAGADLHIAKPVTARGLIEGVQTALATNQAGLERFPT